MDTNAQPSLDRSLEWVRQNPWATNHDVPAEFIHEWSYTREEDEATPCGFHMTVFTFGYMQYQALRERKNPGKRLTVGLAQLVEHFMTWQLKLALCDLNRKTDLRSKALPLFGFPKGEQVAYWSETSAANPPTG